MKEGSKYQRLRDYLRDCDRAEVTLTFAEIEALMQETLPDSARAQRAWWSNRRTGALQALAWMEAGYRVEAVDLEGERVIWRKPMTRVQVRQAGDTVLWNSQLIKALRLHMGLTQTEFANKLGVYQQTVSQWEKGAYEPTLATSKYLTLVAEQAGFKYGREK